MNYQFPIIRHIDDILPLLKDRKEFGVYEKDGGYTVINYNVAFEDTFPPVKTEADALLRECRGIIFRTSDGSVMARRYHKFFNVGEREETSPQFIDLSKPHIVLEKLDGSMITPLVADGRIRWGTKMGITDVSMPVEEFVEQHPHYEELASFCLAHNQTPIFEWCSRKQKIVLDYPEDRLILTAIRENKYGFYRVYGSMVKTAEAFNIPVVKMYDSKENIRELMEYIKTQENTEGVVVRFDDGHMVKVKCEWYMQLHHAKDVVRFEKNVLQIVLEDKVDDLIPLLQEDEVKLVRQYQKDVWDGIDFVAERLEDLYMDIFSKMKTKVPPEKREFAVHFVKYEAKAIQPFLFGRWDKKSMRSQLIDGLLKSCSSQNRLENNRWMMNGVKFNEVKGTEDNE